MKIKINLIMKRVMHGYVIEEIEHELFFSAEDNIFKMIEDAIYSVLSCMYFTITMDRRAYYCSSDGCIEVKISVESAEDEQNQSV